MKKILTVSALAWGLCLSADDWTRFRGSQGTGISSEVNLPVELDAEKHKAWSVDLPGRGLSSPIIIGDKLFLTASSGPNQNKLHVLCFDASSGAKHWERTVRATGRTMCHEKTCVAAPTPASDGKRIFALYSSNDLVAYDLDGRLQWFRGLTQDYPNASNSLGMSSSPIIIGDVLVVQIENDAESFSAGIHTGTGKNLWKIARPKAANWTSPMVYKDPNSGQELAILQSSKGATAVDPQTGKILWDYAEGASTIPSGAIQGDTLYLVSNGITAVKPKENQATPETLWQANRIRPGTASPIALGDYLYAANNAGVVTCANLHNGERVWQLRLDGPFSASPVQSGAYLYFVNESGTVQVVDTNAPEGAIAGEMKLEETILSTPSIGHSALYLRSDKKLHKIAKSFLF